MRLKYITAGIWKRPIVPVEITYNKKSVSYLALIDSGADFNIFHKDIADILKIDLTKLKKVPFGGISSKGGRCEGSFVEVQLKIGKWTTKSMVMFSEDISDDGYGILGQQDFFTKNKITFNYKNSEITVLPNISRAN